MSDSAIKHEYDQLYQEDYYAWNPFYPLADRDLRQYLGDQWDANEKKDLFQEGRNAYVFNYIRRVVNLVDGYQRKHRLSSVVSPRGNQDALTADQMSKCLIYAMNTGDAYHTISNCFSGALKTGWNLAHIYMDYIDDPVNGEIKFQRVPFNGFITDPYFTQHDFSDCSHIIMRKYLGVDQVRSLLPGQEEDVDKLYRYGWNRDDKFTWLPYQREPNGEDLLSFNEFYQQKWRNVPMLVDMETGEYTEFEVGGNNLKDFLKKYPQLKVIKKPKRYIVKHIIVNDQVMRSEENPYGLDEYPLVPFFAIFEPESDLWELKVQSLTRAAIDPQKELNRRRSQMVDILDSQINSGWIADENSVVNPRSLFQASQGKVVWRNQDSRPGAVEKIPPGQIPPSMFQLQELYDKDIPSILGVNEAAFGEADNAGESGILTMLRQGAALINLQDLFDQLRNSQKALSTKVLKLIQTWSPSKIQRITEQEPTPQFFDKDSTKFDVVVKEGILTDTQQQNYFRQLVDLKQLGAPVTGEMLAREAPIQGKSDYLQQVAQMEQQQAQAAQQQAQLQNELVQSDRQMREARAISDIALSKERFTRAVANMGLEDERTSKSAQDRADSALSRVKAMKELESMDADTLHKYLTLVRIMESMNEKDEKETKQEDVQISAEGERSAQASQIPSVEEARQMIINHQPSEVTNERI